MTTVGWLHVLGVWFAVVFGLAVLIGRKGDGPHRWMGRAFVASMLLVNVAALLPDDGDPPDIFALVALVSIAALALGVLSIRRKSTGVRAVASHGRFMAWSFVTLLAATAGQGAVAVGWPVLPWIVSIFLIGGIFIQLSGIHRIARRAVSAQK